MNTPDMLPCPVPAKCQGCGEPANDARFIIDHWSAHYCCGSRLDVATDGTVTWDLPVHQPGTIEYENTRHYRQRI